jgi:AbrB family looped-hinge helix DNA binding protein
VVIPKEIRDMLGIVSGDEVIFEVSDKETKLKPDGAGSSVTELTEIVP